MKYRMMACVAVAMAATTVMADEEHYDIWLAHAEGRLTIGAVNEEGTETTAGVRVFGAELGEAGIPNFADEPGMQSPDGTFLLGARVQLNILRAVRSWNGVDFSSVSDSTITLDFGPATMVSPTTDVFTSGFSLVADEEGGIHDHPSFTLNSPGLSGIYLLEMSISAPDGEYSDSLPFWIVFNNGLAEADHELAIEWVEQNLVPAPAVLPLMTAGLFGVRRRRR